MTVSRVVLGVVLALPSTGATRPDVLATQTKPAQGQPAAAAQAALSPDAVDKLLAPVALYPDQLLTQMLLSTKDPAKIQELSGWLVRNSELTGTALQNAAERDGYEPSFVVMTLFPQVVNFMADNIGWTKELGKAFATDRKGVLDSVQRLRAAAKAAGTLKSTPQQQVETKTTTSGEQAIVIEPANPQVVYVPQYNSQVVYVQPSSTTVVVKEDNSSEAAAAGAIVGFAAGIAIGAVMDNDYYYGPYGWHGGGYMYNDAWDDFYDDREDAREDFYDHREDARENSQDRREDMADQRSERAGDAREQRSERTSEGRSSSTASVESRGRSGADRQTAADRSGTRSDAFSGYSSGTRERSASSRGRSSRGGRSGGGGRRR